MRNNSNNSYGNKFIAYRGPMTQENVYKYNGHIMVLRVRIDYANKLLAHRIILVFVNYFLSVPLKNIYEYSRTGAKSILSGQINSRTN